MYSIKPHGAYLIFLLFGAGLIRGWGLFGGGAYSGTGLIWGRGLFGDGAYLGTGLIRGRDLFKA